MHSLERPFKCTTCGKTFKIKRDLIRHKMVHTDECPFMCEKCGNRYRTKRSLQLHGISHRNIETFSQIH